MAKIFDKLKCIVPGVGFALLFVLMISACEGSVSAEAAAKDTEYATFYSVDYDIDEEVICHEETGVCYLIVYSADHNRVGVTVMVNPDGSPYVWEVAPDE